MISRDTTHLLRRLNSHCVRTLEAAANLCQGRMSDEITIEHWLLKLIEAGDGDIPAILRHYQLDTDIVWDGLLNAITHLPRQLRGKPSLSLQLATVLEDASRLGATDDGESLIRSGHLLQAVLNNPHVLRAQDAWILRSINAAQISRLLPRIAHLTCESTNTLPATHGATSHEPATAALREKPEQSGVAGTPPIGLPGPEARDDVLERFAIDLTAKAARGEIDPVFGRDREIQQMVDVLARRRKNNPILVGEPGVGKTALVEGLALRVADADVPAVIRDVRILTLDLGLLQAGAGVKGEFEQRLKNVIDAVQASPVPILLFIDEAHTLIGAGNSVGGADAANLLKPALARGELRTIAATTWAEYKEFFERDAALERRFQIIKVGEPDDETACLMLRGLKSRYEDHHQVHILDDALVAAVKLSRRYIPSRQLPDKAVDLIDTAAARVRMGLDIAPTELQQARSAVTALELEEATLQADIQAGIEITAKRAESVASALIDARTALARMCRSHASELELVRRIHAYRANHRRDENIPDTVALVDARDQLAKLHAKTPMVFVDVDAAAIARVVAEWTGVPVGNLMQDELHSLLKLEHALADRVIGQDAALTALAEGLRTAKAGLKHEHAPLGVFLLVGPSGVGKTETALALADILFGGEAALTTINMSEYQESHTVSQLKGAPPGYVGYGRGGILTEAVRRRPYSVILLDEVEKAHRDVLDLFYQVFDRGMMRDGEGREIDFRHCVILMTSNLASAEIDEATLEQADISQQALLDMIRPQLSAHFQPALLARFQSLIYRPLDVAALESIVGIKLSRIGERLRRQHDILLECDQRLVSGIAQLGLARESGARCIDAFLNQQVLPAVSRELLSRMLSDELPGKIRLSYSEQNNLIIDFIDPAPRITDTPAPMHNSAA